MSRQNIEITMAIIFILIESRLKTLAWATAPVHHHGCQAPAGVRRASFEERHRAKHLLKQDEGASHRRLKKDFRAVPLRQGEDASALRRPQTWRGNNYYSNVSITKQKNLQSPESNFKTPTTTRTSSEL